MNLETNDPVKLLEARGWKFDPITKSFTITSNNVSITRHRNLEVRVAKTEQGINKIQSDITDIKDLLHKLVEVNK